MCRATPLHRRVKPGRTADVQKHFKVTWGRLLLLLLSELVVLLELPLLVFVSRVTTQHMGVRTARRCAISGDAHVCVRVVDGPVLYGSDYYLSKVEKAQDVLFYLLQVYYFASTLFIHSACTCLNSQRMVGGLLSLSSGQCFIPMEVLPSTASAHSSVTVLKRISFWVVYSKYWEGSGGEMRCEDVTRRENKFVKKAWQKSAKDGMKKNHSGSVPAISLYLVSLVY